jgi:hypothetical protein
MDWLEMKGAKERKNPAMQKAMQGLICAGLLRPV